MDICLHAQWQCLHIKHTIEVMEILYKAYLGNVYLVMKIINEITSVVFVTKMVYSTKILTIKRSYPLLLKVHDNSKKSNIAYNTIML